MSETIKIINESPKFSAEQKKAIDEIGYIRQKCNVMGANHYEFPALRALELKVRNGEIDPQEAITEAHNIYNKKSTYR